MTQENNASENTGHTEQTTEQSTPQSRQAAANERLGIQAPVERGRGRKPSDIKVPREIIEKFDENLLTAEDREQSEPADGTTSAQTTETEAGSTDDTAETSDTGPPPEHSTDETVSADENNNQPSAEDENGEPGSEEDSSEKVADEDEAEKRHIQFEDLDIEDDEDVVEFCRRQARERTPFNC